MDHNDVAGLATVGWAFYLIAFGLMQYFYWQLKKTRKKLKEVSQDYWSSITSSLRREELLLKRIVAIQEEKEKK